MAAYSSTVKTIKFLFIIFFSVVVGKAAGDVKLPAIFGDHMVLQRSASVPVWGWAAPGEPVTVLLGSAKASTIADKDGKWMARLQSLNASMTAGELDIVGPSNKIAIHDVLIGDVWICAGQSDMSFPLKDSSTSKTELPLANHPEIRFFVEKFHTALIAETDCDGSWVICTPKTAGLFSAVGYFFAKEMTATESIPIGMIGLYGGDATAQAWTSLNALRKDADLNKRFVDHILPSTSNLEEIQQAHDQWLAAGGETYLDSLNEWATAVSQAKTDGQQAPQKPKVPAGLTLEPPRPNDFNLPSVLNNAMIAPIVPFALKGVIWYQGDSNWKQPNIYRKLFSAMISDWRQSWGQGNFPFLYVQLPNFKPLQSQPIEDNPWSSLRDAQLMTLKTVPNVGMAITIDIGESGRIRPSDKADVAHRLALGARHIAYGEDIGFSGPIFDSYKIDEGKIHIIFKNVGQGLKIGISPLTPQLAPDTLSGIKGFAIAGADHKFVWAKAEIEAPDTICISSDLISEPVNVRYGWASNPEINLYNSDNLPASPFRSDVPIISPSDADLVAQIGDFFTIDKIHFNGNSSNTPSPVYKAVPKLDKHNIPRTVKMYVPYLEVGIHVRQPVQSTSLVARAYFYDQDKRPIADLQEPTAADRENHLFSAWPALLLKDVSQSIFFAIPDQVQQESNWSVVVIFGDASGVTSQSYPDAGQLSEYDYPGKTPGEHTHNVVSIEAKPQLDPIISHVEPTGNPDQPRITLFMRLPLGTSNSSEAKGVLCLCSIANRVEDLKLLLQGNAASDQIGDVLKFANDHKLIVLAWGSSRGLWDPKKSWDEQAADTTWDTDEAFDQVAQAWSSGVQYFVKEYGIPQNNYLLWGESGSAQYACRLALRKPEYFLAIHAHIPSSFDKPTPQANRVLWCLTTGELESGHARSLRFYSQCRALGYPIIYKAVVGLGHARSPISANLGLKFFEYALTMQGQRLAYDQSLNNPLAQAQIARASDGTVQPWPASFQNPAFVGDIVNQELFPSDQTDMVPPGLRTSLPTQEIANAWNK